MDSAAIDYWTARALLEWQVEMGADEAILDEPVDRFALVDETPQPAAAAKPANDRERRPPPPPVPIKVEIDPVAEARKAVQGVTTLDALAAAMEAFTHCDIRKGAKNLVFSDGNPAAKVMIITEAPGREEDIAGKPFAGSAAVLLDRMLDAIGLSRSGEAPDTSVYLTSVLPWRPPGNRPPEKGEIDMMLPFLTAHIAIVNPALIVLMGNAPCQALLDQGGITRLRGNWVEVLNRPALPMFHPAYLLRTPLAKREAWADLLDLKSRLKALP